MRLIVTRPEPDAGETAAKLRALGHTVIVAPMLEIVFAIPPLGLPPPGAILLTSRNALRALLTWPDAAAWRALPVFAVGPETAALARESGFAEVRVALGNAAALLELVVAEFDQGRGPLLYPAARNRAADIDGALAERGVTVKAIEAYRAIAAKRLEDDAAAALGKGEVDGVLIFSRRTAAAFCDAAAASGVGGALAGLAFYALSEEAAEPLRRIAGARKIRIAGRPDGDALFALLGAKH